MCASSHHKRRLWHSVKRQFRRRVFFCVCVGICVCFFVAPKAEILNWAVCTYSAVFLYSFLLCFPPCVPLRFPRLQLHCYKQSSHCALLLSRERDGEGRVMQGVKTNEGEGGLKRNGDSETKAEASEAGLYCRSDASSVMWRQSPSWAQRDSCAWSQP